jgi:hypothetical protein
MRLNSDIRTLSADEIDAVAGGDMTPQEKADAALAAIADFVKQTTASTNVTIGKMKEALR